MNKAELIAAIAEKADINKSKAAAALDQVICSVSGALRAGDKVTLVGFGTFSVRKRRARTGRNPQTGAEINIKARSVPRFKPGKQLKDWVS